VEFLNHLHSEFRDNVEFLMVYIREAHASDEWPLGKTKCVPQHKTLQDRIAVASELIEKYGFTMKVVVDSMDNQFNNNFHVWPERYFLFSGYNLEYVSKPTNEFGFDRLQLRSVIGSFIPTFSVEPLPACKYPVHTEKPISCVK